MHRHLEFSLHEVWETRLTWGPYEVIGDPQRASPRFIAASRGLKPLLVHLLLSDLDQADQAKKAKQSEQVHRKYFVFFTARHIL